MDVDLGRGLGDDLAGFDGLDDLFAPNNSRENTPDFFKFCALEDGAEGGGGGRPLCSETGVGPIVTAPSSPGSCARNSWMAASSDRDFGQHEMKADMKESLGALGGMGMMNTALGGKPRARKRHDEDDALESLEEASSRPIPKRRSSAQATEAALALQQPATQVKLEHLAPASRMGNSSSCNNNCSTNQRQQQQLPSKPNAPTRAHSFHVSAATGWNPPTLDRSSSTTALDKNYAATGKDGNVKYESLPAQARGGAIKVKKDVLSRPRISVFMSRPRPKRPSVITGNRKLAAALALDMSSSGQDARNAHRSALVNTAALPGSYDHGSTMTTLEAPPAISRAASANRFKDLRITVGRTRSLAEQSLVESTPPVVAMGQATRRGSSPALDELFAQPPTLERATSVGALTIPGKGDVFAPMTMSPTSGVLPTYELSDKIQAGNGTQRRNLVCKVIGSPVSRGMRGPGGI